jgi:hypothetical protein
LDLVLASVSAKARGWMKNFFYVVLTTGSSLGTYSNCIVVPREEPLPVSGSFSFGALGERLVVGFLGDIVPLKHVKTYFFDKHGVDTSFQLFIFLLWILLNPLKHIMNFFRTVQEILTRKDLTMSLQAFNSGYE